MLPPPQRNAALVIVGHGSTVNPDSSEPTWRHADEIRRRGIFQEVACCFWKEEPSMAEIYDTVESDLVYMVPNFISEGYFCQEVLPRELRVTPPQSTVEGKTVRYCDPVGIHPNMTRLLLKRAAEVAPDVPKEQTTLIIVGHGTSLNDNSTKAIRTQVELIRDGGHGFAEVLEAYMEEAPFIAEWDKLSSAPNVVVVPFFIADGLHSFQDIPVLLGIAADEGLAASQSDVFRNNPYHARERTLYYSSAIGTEELMADVILDQVAAFDEKHGAADGNPMQPVLTDWLLQQLQSGSCTVGQVLVKSKNAGYELRHHADIEVDPASLTMHHGSSAARQLSWLDDAGQFRGLKSAPSLKRGWLLEVTGIAELRLALDYFHPAAVGLAYQEAMGTLKPTPLRDCLGKQTGRYRFAGKVTDDEAMEAVATICDSATRCTRRIAWGLTAERPLYGPAEAEARTVNSQIPLLCKEACPLLIDQSRKVARERFLRENPPA
jgi:sirohydrochlorin cobaltochelatase